MNEVILATTKTMNQPESQNEFISPQTLGGALVGVLITVISVIIKNYVQNVKTQVKTESTIAEIAKDFREFEGDVKEMLCDQKNKIDRVCSEISGVKLEMAKASAEWAGQNSLLNNRIGSLEQQHGQLLERVFKMESNLATIHSKRRSDS